VKIFKKIQLVVKKNTKLLKFRVDELTNHQLFTKIFTFFYLKKNRKKKSVDNPTSLRFDIFLPKAAQCRIFKTLLYSYRSLFVTVLTVVTVKIFSLLQKWFTIALRFDTKKL